MTAFFTASEVGVILTGIAAIVGAALGVIKFWQERSERRIMQHCDAAFNSTMRAVLKGLANATMRQIRDINPEDLISFDFRLKSGETLCIPLMRMHWVEYMPGLKVMLIRHTKSETEILMDVAVPSFLPWHSHSEAESVSVIRGRMIDLQTAHVYNVGETWEIPAEQYHRAQFDAGTLCRVVCKPPLPNAVDRPIDLARMEAAFDFEA